MRKCNKMIKHAIGLIYGEIEGKDRQLVEDHLKQCDRCSMRLEEIRRILVVMDHYQRYEPEEAFWGGYWERLIAKIKPPAPKEGLGAKVKRRLTVTYVPSYKWAVGLAILLIGIFLANYYFNSKHLTVDKTLTLVDYRARKYVERSKVLLLGLVNLQLKADEKIDLSKEKEVSRSLIKEASFLKENLKGKRGERLQDLIEDLEAILIEIANLEEKEDLPGVELLRDGIDRRGILLKINVYEMEATSSKLRRSQG